MSYVVSIDVGIKNLGLCVFDFCSSKVIYWANCTLVPGGRYLPQQNVRYVLDFVAQHKQYFDDSQVVVVERQMRCNMRIIEAVVQALFFRKCLVISPKSVKMHYNLSMRNYRQNKAKAVEFVEAFVDSSPTAFAEGVASVFKGSRDKRDDLADSLLLCLYYLDTYSNQLTGGVIL